MNNSSKQSHLNHKKFKIGEGSFGKVYRFSYQSQEYAVKKIYRDAKNHPELVEQIEAEGKIMRRIPQHRNVIAFLGQMIKGKYIYLLTQFVPHGDLRKLYIKKQQDLWQIVMQMSLALNHLRKNKIVHRDIKPQNILIHYQNKLQNNLRVGSQTHQNSNSNSKPFQYQLESSQLTLKLADFGLAQVLEPDGFLEGIAGSPIYLAPQMCRHEPYGYQVDIWSLGITLYQLANNQQNPYQKQIKQYIVSKKHIFTQKQLLNHLKNVIQAKVIKCESPFAQFNMLVQQMLNHDRNKRPTPHQILSHHKVTERLILYSKCQRPIKKLQGFQFLAKTLSTKQFQSFEKKNIKIDSPPQKNHNNIQNQNKSNKIGEEIGNKQLSPICSFDNVQLFLSSRLSSSIIGTLLKDDENELFYQVQGAKMKKQANYKPF